jgi:hypothetical protein
MNMMCEHKTHQPLMMETQTVSETSVGHQFRIKRADCPRILSCIGLINIAFEGGLV